MINAIRKLRIREVVMKIKKIVQGKCIELELIKIKDYQRTSLYQIYKIVNDKRIPLYKECYTKQQIEKIKLANYCIEDENFN